MAAYARGAVELAEGNPHAALSSLRCAFEVWQQVEGAVRGGTRRALIGLACRALGDDDGGGLELEAARAVFEHLGATPDLDRIDVLTRGARSGHRHGLTPRELQCTGEAARSTDGAVWGTDVYTDDFDLCRAALHAGVIGTDGGPITVPRSKGRALYIGSSRNAVASNDYGSYDASIAFTGTASPPRGPEPCPGSLVINRDLPTPFTCTCRGEAARRGSGAVWGTDAYADRSDLCRAALHAEVITAEGGSITVTRSEGRTHLCRQLPQRGDLERLRQL